MGKTEFKPGNMIYPLPAVLVTVSDGEKDNVLTVAWTGTVCTNPPMAYISVRPERYSYDMIKKSGEYVINLTTEAIAKETDFCGVTSGRDVDKFEKCGFTKEKAALVKAPLIKECPVNIECKVRDVMEYGSHTMFVADVVKVHVDESLIDETGRFALEQAGLIVYSHGQYMSSGDILGTFGYSVKKKSGK